MRLRTKPYLTYQEAAPIDINGSPMSNKAGLGLVPH